MCVLLDFNAAPEACSINEICEVLHENNVMLKDTEILSDETY